MKIVLTVFAILIYSVAGSQQPRADTIIAPSINYVEQPYLSVSESSPPEYLRIRRLDTVPDVRPHNIYGDLLNDDPAYNKKYPWPLPAMRVIVANALTWAGDRYVLNADFSHIGPTTWKRNLKEGWEWDADRFGINFIGHPFTGSTYFNIGRSNGYSYWGSLPFAIE